MSIASRITSIEGHIADDYNALEDIGADLTNVDKNIENIKNVLADIYDEMPKVSDTGTDLTLENTRKGAMAIKYKGQTQQASEPTPSSPQPIHNVSGDNTIEICGKNIFEETQNKKDITSQYQSVVYGNFSLVNGETYTLSVDTNNNGGTVYINETYFNHSTSATLNCDGTRKSYTCTAKVTGKYSNASLIKTSSNVSTSYNLNNVMLEKGSTATEYKPYQEVQSQLISLGVENLFDKDNANVLNAYINSSGKILNDNDNRTIWLQINKNTNYTFQMKQKALSTSSATDYVRIALCETQPTGDLVGSLVYSQYRTSATEDYNYESTFNSGNNSYVAIRVVQTERSDYNTSITTVQLEKGSKANSYSEYGKPYIELNKISTYQDYIYKSSGKWYLHKEIGKVVLDGSEDWTYANDTFYISSIDNYLKSNNIPYSNYYKGISNVSTVANINNNNICFKNSLSPPRLYIRDDSITSSSDFETWLSTHNTDVYYVLSTPTNTEITDTTLIGQLETIKRSYDGVTNISQENNDLPFILDVSALKEWNNE